MEKRNNRPKPGGRRQRGGASEDKKSGSQSGYKAKRSFTKNKDLRDKKKSGDRPYRSSGAGAAKRPVRPFDGGKERRPYRASEAKGERRPSGDRERDKRPFRSRENDGEERYDRPEGRSKFPREGERTRRGERPERPFRKGDNDHSSRRGGSRDEERPYRSASERVQRESSSRDREDSSREGGRKWDDRKGKGREGKSGDRAAGARSYDRGERGDKSKRVKFDEFEEGHAFTKHKATGREKEKKQAAKNDDGLIRLNKYLSNAGIASRREADTLIQSGAVKVNGVVVDQLGYKIKPTDKVTYGDESVKAERKVYLLLNKPKDYITTVDDPRDRKTVMELITGACRERVYPVGRLDRNTTGLLLFTNDGELTTRLTHPKHNIKKVYHVTLNKGLKIEDFRKIIEGVELEDGVAKADDLAFVGEGKKEVGIEIHSGKNRIVRRIFEHLGYDVIKLDRVAFAGLTKKDLPRGKYRFLTQKEIGFLHMIG